MSNATIWEEKIYTELNFIHQELAALKAQWVPVMLGVASHPYIERDLAMHSGEPTVRGSAITVRTIVERTQLGDTPAEIVEAYPVLTLARVHAALGYYYDCSDEIDRYIRENQEALWQTAMSVSS